jgi:hypothetical protein
MNIKKYIKSKNVRKYKNYFYIDYNFCEIEMCLNEKLSHNIKVKTRSGEFFFLRKNDFLKLSVNFQESTQKFLNSSLLKYLKFNDEKKRVIKRFERTHPELFKHNLSHADSINAGNNNDLEQIKEDSEENSQNSKTSNEMQSHISNNLLNNSSIFCEDNKPSFSNDTLGKTSPPLIPPRGTTILKSKTNFNNISLLRNAKSYAVRENHNNLLDVKDEVDDIQKSVRQKFSNNIDKVVSILEKNKLKFNTINSETNPLNLCKKLKHTVNLKDRWQILDKLETLVAGK